VRGPSGVQTWTSARCLVVKNLTNSLAHEPGWVGYAPNPYPRWSGLVFSGKL
jgi:iron complex outermembrane receptor protein